MFVARTSLARNETKCDNSRLKNSISLSLAFQATLALLAFGSLASAAAAGEAHLSPLAALSLRDKTRALNVTHVAFDELTNSVYLGAANWLLQLSAHTLQLEQAVRVGPLAEPQRDCAPADCGSFAQPVELSALPFTARLHRSLADLRAAHHSPRASPAPQSASASASASATPGNATTSAHNNYNKLLLVDGDARQLIACYSASQGACRKHALGDVGNASALIGVPVAANDEHSSTVALIARPTRALYVAATNTRAGAFREMVPALSARHASNMQIVEQSIVESARVDVAFGLRDYYLVSYVRAFQVAQFVYVAQVQRKSPLRQLEESGFVTRVARVCLSDPSMQTYVELTLECRDARANYNLLQAATLVDAPINSGGGGGGGGKLLVGAFAVARDHSTRAASKSAICAFGVDAIEQKIAESVQLCYNGTQKSRNMDYIAGSVSECPAQAPNAEQLARTCSEPLKLNASLALSATPLFKAPAELLTAVAATSARTSQRDSTRANLVLLVGTASGALKRLVVDAQLREAREFDSTPVADTPILPDLHVLRAARGEQYAVVAASDAVARVRISGCSGETRAANASLLGACEACARLDDPFCGWCASAGRCAALDECARVSPDARALSWTAFDAVECGDYAPLAPPRVVRKSPARHARPFVAVNAELRAPVSPALAQQLALAHFSCQFLANDSRRSLPATPTVATQARLNAHANVASIGCQLPAPVGDGERRALSSARLVVRLPASLNANVETAALRAALGMRRPDSAADDDEEAEAAAAGDSDERLERSVQVLDCAALASCGACVGGASLGCGWCAASGECVDNATSGECSQRLLARVDECAAATSSAAPQLPPPDAATATGDGSEETRAPLASVTNAILVAHNSRRAVSAHLSAQVLRRATEIRALRKLECAFLIDARAIRVPAKLASDATNSALLVNCNDASFAYAPEVATLDARLSIVADGRLLVAQTNVTLYKCHLFGATTVALGAVGARVAAQLAAPLAATSRATSGDCSQCAAVERKFRCVWCNGQCAFGEQCTEAPSNACPPPKIYSIRPTSGPLEGGTLLVVEGANLATSERDLKVSVGELCEVLVFVAASKVVCRTAASTRGRHSAAVFVGNKASITQASEHFHYKAIHLADATPKFGPVSGGTRLTLTGANLNIGSQVQVLLDDTPCPILPNLTSSERLVCVTAPNLFAATNQRAATLTLTVDNSTHVLPLAFSYLPDPIITSIEPTESFESGGRLMLVAGKYLNSPHSLRLQIADERLGLVVNSTTCQKQNDSLVTCFTPAVDRSAGGASRFELSFAMDGVQAVQRLQQYYSHLPHSLSYVRDPLLEPLQPRVVAYAPELVIRARDTDVRGLELDMLVMVGKSVCALKSIGAAFVVCEPPANEPLPTDELERPTRNQLPAVVALVGSNLRYELGFMQYPSSPARAAHSLAAAAAAAADSAPAPPSSAQLGESGSALALALTLLLGVALAVVCALSAAFAVARFKAYKSDEEFRRIQMQMGAFEASQKAGRVIVDSFGRSVVAAHDAFGSPQVSPSRALNFPLISDKRVFEPFVAPNPPQPQPHPFNAQRPLFASHSPATLVTNASSASETSNSSSSQLKASSKWTQAAPATVVPYALIEACIKPDKSRAFI